MRIEYLRYGFSPIFDSQPGLPAIRIDRGRIAKFIREVRHHNLQNLRVKAGSGGIVEVDSFHSGAKLSILPNFNVILMTGNTRNGPNPGYTVMNSLISCMSRSAILLAVVSKLLS